MQAVDPAPPRRDWTLAEVEALFAPPLADLGSRPTGTGERPPVPA
jgi:hypothetical protein